MRLSPNAILKFQTCPRQYYFYYVKRWRTLKTAFALPFGRAVHKAIEKWFKAQHAGEDLVIEDEFERVFRRELLKITPKPDKRWDVDSLVATGRALAQKFPPAWAETGLMPVVDDHGVVVERELRFEIIPGVDILTYLDLLAMDTDGLIYLIDAKTPTSPASGGFTLASDQLTTMQIGAERNADTLGIEQVDRLGFLELVKRKTGPKAKVGPTVEPLQTVPRRGDQEIEDFLSTVRFIAHCVRRGDFPRFARQAYNTPCDMCDFADLCLRGNADGLVQADKAREIEQNSELFADVFLL